MKLATHVRTLQFQAGPGEFEFAACDDCLPQLAAGDVSLFFARKGDPPPVALGEGEERRCDLCAEPND